jgi:protein SCO1/2
VSIRRRLAIACLGGVAAVLVPLSAHAQRATPGGGGSTHLNSGVPPELQGVDIEERLDAKLPLDLPFIDTEGREIRLGALFGKDRPIVLQIGYLRCPMLCNLVLNGAIEGLRELDWSAGKEFDLVAVTINPNEGHELAKVKRDGYLLEYNRPGAAAGFHFLTGPASSSHALADAVGFRFRQEGDDYAHAAAIFLITPDGRVSRYLYGTKFSPKDLRLGLLEAGEGKIGSTLDRFILWCHVYDPDARGYVLFAMRLMQIGGAVTLVLLGGGLIVLWRQEVRRRRHAASTGTLPS